MALNCASTGWNATRIQAGFLVVDRLAAFFLLEQVSRDIGIGTEPDLIAFDRGDETARDIMVMLFMADAAVGADQLDAIAFNPVDGAEMHAVRTDHFHMFPNVFEPAHDLLLEAQLLP